MKTICSIKPLAQVKLVNLACIGDDTGKLTPIETMRNVPFDIKRVYYIYGTSSGVVRGHHAHKKLKQLLISVSGSIDIMCEYGEKKEYYNLHNPHEGLLIEGLVWHTMQNFSRDAVLLVLASDYYDESDYIRDYNAFLKMK